MTKWFLAFCASLFLLAATSAPAFADEGNERRVALSREYVGLLQVEQGVHQVYRDMLPGLVESYREENADATNEDIQLLFNAMDYALKALIPIVIDDYTQYYAELYSEEELAALVAFYSSDIGKRITQKNNAGAAQLVELNEKHVLQLMKHLFEYLEMHMTPEEKS